MSNLKDDFTAPIFVHSDDTVNVRIVNNLVLGGVFGLFLKPLKGRWVVRGNRVAAGTWAFKPFDTSGHCDNVSEWVANNVVRVDRRYRILSKVRTVRCPS